jgi:hypothetical protein
VVTRRALLAGGAVVLAGCGRDIAAQPLPRPVDALRSQLAAERELVAALGEMSRRGGSSPGAVAPRGDVLPPDDAPALVRDLRRRAAERARRLASAVAAEGGRPHDAPPPDAAGDALAAARAALAAHVAALPALTGRAHRRLAADLVAEDAADLAVLGTTLGAEPEGPFPGTKA